MGTERKKHLLEADQHLPNAVVLQIAEYVGIPFLRISSVSHLWLTVAKQIKPPCTCHAKGVMCRWGAKCNVGNGKCKFCHCVVPRTGPAPPRHSKRNRKNWQNKSSIFGKAQ